MIKNFFRGGKHAGARQPACSSPTMDKILTASSDLNKLMPEGLEFFNEAKYLELNPDVAAAVGKGQFSTGWEHYVRWGRNENRPIFSHGSIPLPPVKLMVYVGSRGPHDFIYVGKEFVTHLQKLCGLKPDDSILDVGCGCGRIAIPLADQLSQTGRFCGFDIDRGSISWAQENITRNRSNLVFVYADIYNHVYNPTGVCPPGEFEFPFEDGSFDVVFLASVFTHLLPPEMEHYLLEIKRVMKKGGKCLITYFLINPESLSLIPKSEGGLKLVHNEGDYWTSNPKAPGAAVGYEEPRVRKLYGEFGLNNMKVYYGSWCGRKTFLSYQDIVVAEKTTVS